jgi:hypothetical protein
LGDEAVLNEDRDAAKQVIFDYYPAFFTLDWMVPGGIVLEPELYTIGRNDTIEVVEKHYDGDYLWYLLASCAYIVQEMVDAFCWPSLSVEEKPRAPVRATASWGVRNLLGAMYLQMYRLMAAGEEVTTCRYCGRVIPLMSSEIGDRKKRQDKKYCNDACRQRYHYHNRVKPRRQKL